MKRKLARGILAINFPFIQAFLAVLITLLLVAQSPAQLIKFTTNDKGKDAPGSRGSPFRVGPWYNYWPMEAHFQVPAVPNYPYWPPPQTLPVAPPSPYNAQPLPGMHRPMPYPNGFGGSPMVPYGANGHMPNMGMPMMGQPSMSTGTPSMMPYTGTGGYPAMTPFPTATGSPGVMPSYPNTLQPGR